MPSSRSACLAIATAFGFLLLCSGNALAQRHGGHAPPNILTRPDGIEQKDTLKDFHQALAVQATSDQIAQFEALRKSTDVANSDLEKIIQSPQNSHPNAALDEDLEAARSQTKKFVDGFSEKQKSGLKEQTRLLERADAALADQQKKFDQAIQTPSSGPLSDSVSSMNQALADFSSQQLALAREMGIVLADAQDVTFNLPAVKTTPLVADERVQVTVSSILSQTATDAGKRTFRLVMMGDFSELQRNLTEVLRAVVRNNRSCGEHLTVQRAVLVPSAPFGTLHLQLHYERWSCMHLSGQSSATEIAESNGDAEMRLVPAMSDGGLHLKAEFEQIDATGMMADSLRNGDLGSDLREKVEQAVLTAMRSAADFKTVLPPALQGTATLDAAKFEDTGAGDLALMLQGKAQLTDEQAKSLASQLNQTLSAEGNGTR